MPQCYKMNERQRENGDIKNSLSKLVFTHPVCVRYCCRHHITNDKLDLCLLMGVKTKCTWNYKKISSYCVIHLYTSIPWRSLFIHLFYKVWENRQSLNVIRASVTLKVNKTECTASSTSRRTAAQVYLPVLPASPVADPLSLLVVAGADVVPLSQPLLWLLAR